MKQYSITPKGFCLAQLLIRGEKVAFNDFDPMWSKFNAWLGARVQKGEIEEGETTLERIASLFDEWWTQRDRLRSG